MFSILIYIITIKYTLQQTIGSSICEYEWLLFVTNRQILNTCLFEQLTHILFISDMDYGLSTAYETANNHSMNTGGDYHQFHSQMVFILLRNSTVTIN
jgi:hypothetical protein